MSYVVETDAERYGFFATEKEARLFALTQMPADVNCTDPRWPVWDDRHITIVQEV